jgi:hypothetical protein
LGKLAAAMLANSRRWWATREAWLFAAGDTSRRLIAEKQFTFLRHVILGRPGFTATPDWFQQCASGVQRQVLGTQAPGVTNGRLVGLHPELTLVLTRK